ncbi:hypothetical protein ACM26V_15835 [Salipaludibacillus sp. HK11]|uniref:hypothetical protein n=1 Tax=Salipaludibacillus sp. HK11 TaxID=3394320 RepID=UPI0039FD5C43
MDQGKMREILKNTDNDFQLIDGSVRGKLESLLQVKGQSAYLNEITSDAEQLLEQTIPHLPFQLFIDFAKTGRRKEFENVYFLRRRRLNTFAIMSIVYPANVAYKQALEDIIWAICAEPSWCLPAHLDIDTDDTVKPMSDIDQWSLENKQIDLFSAETAFALSEIYSLVKDLIEPIVLNRLKQEVNTRVIERFEQKRGYEWESATHNWAAVCAGSIGIATMYLTDDVEVEVSVLSRCVNTLSTYLDGFNDDGVCLEGYSYWQYGFSFYTYFADMFRKRTANRLDLFDKKKVKEIALFQQKCFLFEDYQVPFSDSVKGAKTLEGLSHYLHREYKEVELPPITTIAGYFDDHCSRWGHVIRNLIWREASNRTIKKWGNKVHYLKDSQWYIYSVSKNTDHYSFVAKGGHNLEPHNHNDLGQFVVMKNKDTFLWDLGAGEYTKEYFSRNRYSILNNGSHGHSVPVINGYHQAEGERYVAVLSDPETRDTGEHLEVDLSQAYPCDDVKSFIRKFTVNHTEDGFILKLSDQFAFQKSKKLVIEENFVTEADSIKPVENGLLIYKNQSAMEMNFDTTTLTASVKNVSYKDHFGGESSCSIITLKQEVIADESTIDITFLC